MQTDLISVNTITGGFRSSDLIFIGGDTSSGKSSALKNFIKGIVQQGKSVLIMCIETTRQRFMDRMSIEDFNEHDRKLIFINDKYSVDIIAQYQEQHNIQAVLIDGLEYIIGEGARIERINKTCYELKSLVKTYGILFVVTTPLFTKIYNSVDRFPTFHDLPASAILEVADQIILLYRPELYTDKIPNGSSSKGIAYWIIAKNRNGNIGIADVKFIPKKTKFTDNHK